MKHFNSTLPKYLGLSLLLMSFASLPNVYRSANSQTRKRTVTANGTTGQPAEGRVLPSGSPEEMVKVDVDLVTVDALVLQKDTARVVGGLKKEDFILFEDGSKQEITHFGQDSFPLSVLFLIDRGGCLDPFSAQVHKAALDTLSRLKAPDEVAVMTYHDTTKLLQGFTRDRSLIADALNRVPQHDEEANHCLNKVFAEAARYMDSAGNPTGRRVIIAITGVTRNFDCADGPSGKAAAQAVYESGSVVCGIIPKTGEQRFENGIMTWATRVGHLSGQPYLDIQTLANETGGEVLQDKPENLDTSFNTLMNHLRSRYNLAFVSSNKNRDGSTRKLKIELSPASQNSGKLVVKSRKSYVAPRR